MSIISGLMMGASIGKGIHDMLTGHIANPNDMVGAAEFMDKAMADQKQQRINSINIEPFALISCVPGRRRYRISSLLDNVPLAKLFMNYLPRFRYITKIRANAATGSLLIEYSCDEAIIDKLAVDICDRILKIKLNQQGNETLLTNSCAQTNANSSGAVSNVLAGCDTGEKRLPPTLYARGWRSTGAAINNWVRKATYGCFDIYTLLSLFFLVRGLRKMILFGERPNGPSMVWWSLHLMKGWRG